MRNGFKRLTAALLLICTLASFLVPATFAEDENIVANYNFVLDSAIYGTKGAKYLTDNCACGCGKVSAHLEGMNLGWTYLNENTMSELRYRSDANWGLRLQDENDKNGWAAFKITVPAAGNFTLRYNASKTQSANSTYEAYIFTAEEKGSGTVASLMNNADSHLVGQAVLEKNTTSVDFGSWNFTKEGDYILVLNLVNTKMMYLSSLELIGTPAQGSESTPSTEATEDARVPGTVAESYDFVLYDPQNPKATNDMVNGETIKLNTTKCQCGCGQKFKAALEEKYDSLGWMILDSSISNWDNIAFRENGGWGLRAKAKDSWIALKIKVTTPGTYKLNYISSVASDQRVEAYAFSVSELGDGDIAELMDEQHKLGVLALKTSETSGTFKNDWTVPAAGEYIVAINCLSSNVFLGKLELVVSENSGELPSVPTTQESTAAPSTQETEAPTSNTTATTTPGDIDTTTPGAVVKFYNFTIDAAMGGTRTTIGWSNNCSCGCGKKLREHLEANHDAYGWEYLDDTATGAPLFAKANNWAFRLDDDVNNGVLAVKIDVPAAGTFNLRYTSASVSSTAYKYSAYMLTVDEYENGPATGNLEDNKIGSISLIKGTPTATFGSCTFPVAGQYVLLLKLENTNRFYIQSLELVVPGAEEPEQTLPSTTPTEPLPTECTGTYQEGVYNFALYTDENRAYMFQEEGKFIYKELSKACPVCGKKLRDCIAAQFAENELNWKLENTTFASVAMLADTYATKGYGGMRFRYVYGEDGKILKDEAGKEVEEPGNWAAFRVKVNDPGLKRITVYKDNADSGVFADVYIFPASAAAMSTAELEAQITDANKAGEMTFDRVVKELRIGDWNFETAGEYIILFKTTGSSARFYINGITIETPKEDPDIPAVDKKVYDFDLSREDPLLDTLGAGSRYNNDRSYRVRAYMQDRYAAGTTDWKFEVNSTEFGDTGGSFREGCFRFKNNDNYKNAPGSWYSFRIKNPGTATYDIRLVSSGKSKLVTDIYLIPAPNELILTEEQIEAAMTAENLLVSGVELLGQETFYLGDYTFGKNKEYVLVFDIKLGTILYMKELQMTIDGLVADGTIPRKKTVNGTVYDFDLTDGLYGTLNEKTAYLQDYYKELERRYKNGSINWMWYDCSSELKGNTVETMNTVGTTVRFYRDTGMRIYAREGYWAAFKIKSPGSGTFTLSMDFAKYASGGTLAFYILPADTPENQVWEATDHSNRVGTIDMYTDKNDLEDGFSSYIGYWDFEAGKEYILVMEAYANSPYSSSYCYANFSQLYMERGKIAYTQEDDKLVKPITVVEKALKVADFRGNAAIKEIGGHDYYIMPCEGGTTLVYDLDTEKLVDSFGDGFGLPAGVYEDSEGIIWIAGSAKKLQRYDPYTQISTTYSWTAYGLWHIEGGISLVEYDNKIYIGSNHNGYLLCFDKETGIFREVIQLIGGKGDAVRGLMYLNGYMYMSVSSDEGIHVVKFDPVTEKEVIVKNLKDVQGKASGIGRFNVMGDGELLVCGTYGGTNFNQCIVLDPETLELVETELPDCVMSGATEIVGGKQYMAVVNGFGLWQYDVETKVFSRVPGMPAGGIGFVSDKTLITLDGKEYLFTASTSSGGNPRLYDLDKKEYTAWDNLVKDGDGGTRLLSIAVGEGDDNGLYIGGFNTKDCVVYDTEKGEITATYVTGGQGDSSIWYNGKLYYGNYSSTTLNEIYPYTGDMNKDPRDNDVIQRWQLNHEETGQKRVLELAAGDGYVFAGTVPDTNQWGGSITVYNTKTGQWYTHRNIVEDHSITGLAHSGKLAWASSAFTPGTGTTVDKEQKENAQIVAYDYEKREVVARFDPADYIPGLATPVLYIAGIEADPIVENRIWAAVSETVFCFDYNPDTKEFKVQEIFSFKKDTYHTQSGRVRDSHDFLFDTERGYVYFGLNTGAGMYRFQIEDFNAPVGKIKVTSKTRMMGDLTDSYVIGHDGDMYYIASSGTDLKMLPLNVTDADWAISGAVDKMITDLSEITLESEAAVKSARSAYENLSWRYKALSRKLDTLQEAEVDLLECKIDAAVQQEITADSVEPLKALVDEYKAMEARYQNYVKNYDALMTAYSEATALNDERVAKALQERINALEPKFPMTLEIEPEVVAIRTDYDAATPTQRILVDITLLEKAEAEIRVLRAELVKYVEELIQKIPNEITLEAEPVILAAREAADKLYMTERKEVSYSKLTSAEGKLRTLKNAKAAAQEVDALIEAIGIVTLGDKDRIAQAREAYDSLKDAALQFVTKGKKLQRAEFILKALQSWGIPAIVVADAGIVFAVLWFVPSLRTKVFKKRKQSIEN